jgi:hypothetical protein
MSLTTEPVAMASASIGIVHTAMNLGMKKTTMEMATRAAARIARSGCVPATCQAIPAKTPDSEIMATIWLIQPMMKEPEFAANQATRSEVVAS